MGMDVDGPGNDKGLYAIVPVQKHMSIRNEDTVSWNTDLRVGQSRVGFMSQVSPDGQYVLSTFAGPDQSIPSTYFVNNFKDYRFLQVFYPTRGILAWYSRSTGRRQPLPGADDPRFVQTDGVWSPALLHGSSKGRAFPLPSSFTQRCLDSGRSLGHPRLACG